MSGGTVLVGTTTIAGALGAVGSAIGVGSSIAGLAGGGGPSTGSGSAGGGGGGGVQANEQNFYKSNASNPYYGVNVSTKPMEGPQPPKSPEMPVNNTDVNKGKVATARETPTQAEGTGLAKQDFQSQWADRLSKYLDYNTRSLG